MSHSPSAQFAQGTGSGWRTMPTTMSPIMKSPSGGALMTRPSDSWPSTRRSRPGTASPYRPSICSRSVPHTPTARARTRMEPCACGGSAMSSRSWEPGFPGLRVTARIYKKGPRRRRLSSGAGAQGCSDFRLLAVAMHPKAHRVADLVLVDAVEELGDAFHRLAVHGNDDVTGLERHAFRRTQHC